MIEKLEWDSKFFNLKIGKIDVKNPDLDLSKIANLANYDLIYIFSPLPLKNIGVSQCYPRVVYQYSSNRHDDHEKSMTNVNILTEILCYSDFKQLVKLTYQSGEYSRFRLDSNFGSSDFEALYYKWIINSLRGKLANTILVYRGENDSILGFNTISLNGHHASIGLIAVDKETRGKGIGKKLLNATKYLTRYKNKLTVATQLDNTVACRFYNNNGFIESEAIYIYHLWNK